jgi:hypothetical protein
VPKTFDSNSTGNFLELSGSWQDEKNADEIINEIRENRKSKTRFGDINELFD